jgi:hypothetical protein
MFTKPTYPTIILAALTLGYSINATANETSFKIATIKDTLGSYSPQVITFNKNMNTCAVLTKAKKVDESESACTQAITSLKSVEGNNKKVKYLESLSYSNRGVSRYMNNDITGATNDLITAVLLDSNAITIGNLTLINKRPLVAVPDSSTDM